MRHHITVLSICLLLFSHVAFGQIYNQEEIGPVGEKQGLGLGGGIGAVVIDGKLYNSISLRPSFSIGKFGIALDLPLYFDANGNFRSAEWNHPNDIPDKIYYVRYGMPNDDLYIRAGALDNMTLGYGIIIDHYTNTIQYPSVRKIGARFRVKPGPFALEGFVADFKEINGPGLVGARLEYDGLGPFILGATAVSDVNPYLGLPDEDGDGFPNRLDDFPNNKKLYLDSDGDGIADPQDPDRDGDGWADNYNVLDSLASYEQRIGHPLDPGVQLKPDPFNAKNANAPTMTEVGVDIGLPIRALTTRYTKVFLYAQAAQMLPENKDLIQKKGWGVGAPGFRFDFTFPINVSASLGIEYRIHSPHFVGEFFNRSYDIERVNFKEATLPGGGDTLLVQTKAERLLPQIDGTLRGYYSSLTLDLLSYIRLHTIYQDYHGRVDDRSFYGAVDLNTSMIPKISAAYAYYQKSHILNGNLFKTKDESTVLGYKIAYEISGSVNLVFGYRETYLDKNGNGKIDGPGETIATTSLETVFNF